MFRELMPLIRTRSLTITVSSLGGGIIRVKVVPQTLESDHKFNHKIGYSSKDEVAKVPESAIAALTNHTALADWPTRRGEQQSLFG
jgi:hypothetical protein